jgi:CRISPR-associated exonuclease Cas4
MGTLEIEYLFFVPIVPDSEDYVMISALQHYAYCPRQFALIHIEQVWDENIYTLRGQRVHEKVDIPDEEQLDDVRVERALPLWCHRLGIRGIADVVEFNREEIPYPVEYKSGSKKPRLADDIQLCAQALCLEEMLGCDVPLGAIYHAGSKRRREVKIDPKLRAQTEQIIIATREILISQKLPSPVNDKRCDDCSLIDACMPESIANFGKSSVRNNVFSID